MAKRRLDTAEADAERLYRERLGGASASTRSGRIYGDAAARWLIENERRPERVVLDPDSSRWDLRDLTAHDWRTTSPLVYFIQAVSGGPVKIGRSTARAFEVRFGSIQGANVDELRLTRAVLGPGQLETALHKHFGHLRIRGEWFRCDAELARVARAVEQTEG